MPRLSMPCDMVQEGSWRSGHCSAEPIPARMRIDNAIRSSRQGKASGGLKRLYFLDGTFPADLPEGYASHEDMPGANLQHSIYASGRCCTCVISACTMVSSFQRCSCWQQWSSVCMTHLALVPEGVHVATSDPSAQLKRSI